MEVEHLAVARAPILVEDYLTEELLAGINTLRYVWDEGSFRRVITSLNELLELLSVERYVPGLIELLAPRLVLRLWESELSEEDISSLIKALLRAKQELNDSVSLPYAIDELKRELTKAITALSDGTINAQKLVEYVASRGADQRAAAEYLIQLGIILLVLATNP